MKTKGILFILALVVLSCSNDDDNSTVANLVGEWAWVQSSGGLVGNLQTPETVGAERSLIFTSTTLQSFEEGVLVFESEYSLQTLESVLFNEPREMLVSDLSFPNTIEFNGQQLTLIGDCNDCVTSTYIRTE